MDFLKAHWDLLIVVFGFGGLVEVHREQKVKVDKLEVIIAEEIPKIRESLARIDERTKHL